NVFGGGSRTPITITLLVKSLKHAGPTTINYYDIGDYLSTREKLDLIKSFGGYRSLDWEAISPNQHYDWINQRSDDFYEMKSLDGEEGIFALRQRGVETSRDPWVYDFSKENLAQRMRRMINFYNEEVDRIAPALH